MGCTTLVTTPPGTRDGQTYLLWNFDILRPAKLIFDRFRLFVVNYTGYSYVAWGIPGWLHIPLMNEKGLCFVGNVVGMTDGGEGGSWIFEIIAKALNSCSTVEEVSRLYTNSDRIVLPGYGAAVFSNLNSMYADEQGDAITIEYSRNHIAVRHSDELGVMVETNHHQYLNRELSGSADPSKQRAIIGSYARLGRAWELAKEHAGEFDLDSIMRFASDHGQNYSLLSDYDYEVPETGFVDDSTICCHLWNSTWYLRKLRLWKAVKAMLEGETIYSFILQPKQRTIWFSGGKPCRSGYKPYEFVEALQKSPSSKPVEQRLFKGKTRGLALTMLRLAQRAVPLR